MLDRAITLYVRRFASIVAVLAIVSVPVLLVQALAVPNAAHPFNDLARVLSSPSTTRAEPDPFALYARLFTPAALLSIVAAVVFRLLMWGAVVAIVAAGYAGTRMTIAGAYRLALQRWVQQLIVGVAFSIIGSFALIPAFIAYILLIFAVVASAVLKLLVLSIIVGVVGALVVIALFVSIIAVVFMTYELASVAVMTETANPVDAISIAMRRAFAPGMKRRTLVGGIVLGLVSQGGTIPVIAAAAVVSALTHIDALYFAIVGAGTILLEGILAAFVVIYAVDARVRREGYDLLAPDVSPLPT